jgi:hypothetical protein
VTVCKKDMKEDIKWVPLVNSGTHFVFLPKYGAAI